MPKGDYLLSQRYSGLHLNILSEYTYILIYCLIIKSDLNVQSMHLSPLLFLLSDSL